jgi:hypothetical protein
MPGVCARNVEDADYIERDWQSNKGHDIYRSCQNRSGAVATHALPAGACRRDGTDKNNV